MGDDRQGRQSEQDSAIGRHERSQISGKDWSSDRCDATCGLSGGRIALPTLEGDLASQIDLIHTEAVRQLVVREQRLNLEGKVFLVGSQAATTALSIILPGGLLGRAVTFAGGLGPKIVQERINRGLRKTVEQCLGTDVVSEAA